MTQSVSLLFSVGFQLIKSLHSSRRSFFKVKYLHSPCCCDVTLAVTPSAFWVEIVKTNAIIAIITSSTMLPMAIFTLDIFD